MENLKNNLPLPVDSILEAVLTVSPNRQYLGMVKPTTPAAQEPEMKEKYAVTRMNGKL